MFIGVDIRFSDFLQDDVTTTCMLSCEIENVNNNDDQMTTTELQGNK